MMDFSVLLTAPVIAIAIALVLVSAWIGYALGKSNEDKRKQLALTKAGEEAAAALEGLRAEHAEKVSVLNKASSNELEKLKQTHSQQIDQLNRAHQTMVDSLKASHSGEIERLGNEHSALIDKLNAANIANINELKKGHEQQVAEINGRSAAAIQEIEQRRRSDLKEIKAEMAETIANLKSEQQNTTQSLRRDHEQVLTALKRDSEHALAQVEKERDRRLLEMKQRNAEDVARLAAQVSGLRVERDGLKAEMLELNATLSGLQEDIKEAKMKNMFSVSKSGEKLIRVVRTVQELASELDETSRAVTGGEYSFFDEIKDQRDKETVLSLTGGGTYAHAEASIDASAIDGETDLTEDPAAMDDTDAEILQTVDEAAEFVEEETGEPKVQQ